jgi:hypothetical protein
MQGKRKSVPWGRKESSYGRIINLIKKKKILFPVNSVILKETKVKSVHYLWIKNAYKDLVWEVVNWVGFTEI